MILLAVMGTALMLAGGVALAANIECPNRSDGRCVGTLNSDVMVGSRNADDMSGRPNNDVMTGRGGPDIMVGDEGTDTVNGGPGNDRLEGGTEEDELKGRKGDDRIFTARDRDSDAVTCGPGQDFAKVGPTDVIENQQVGETTESVLETSTTCEDIEVVIIDNPPL